MDGGWQFSIGKDVVCITDDWPIKTVYGFRACVSPEKGRIYRVHDVGMLHDICRGVFALALKNECVLRLAEYGQRELWFSAAGFRPVRETTIEIFSAALAPKPKEMVHGHR